MVFSKLEEETNLKNLQPFYGLLHQFGIEKQGVTMGNHVEGLKQTVIDIIETFQEQNPVTKFTSEAQWYIAIDVGIDVMIAKRNLVENNLVSVLKLSELSPYSYYGHSGSPLLLYKAADANGRNFGLVNPYLDKGEALALSPNPNIQELLQMMFKGQGTVRQGASLNAYEPSTSNKNHPYLPDVYVNIEVDPLQLILGNIALESTEFDYDDELDEYLISNPYEIFDNAFTESEPDYPESFYLMYAIGKAPFKRATKSLNHPRGGILNG